eukprot:3436787-Amphidinium_carterae.1
MGDVLCSDRVNNENGALELPAGQLVEKTEYRMQLLGATREGLPRNVLGRGIHSRIQQGVHAPINWAGHRAHVGWHAA